LIILTQQEQTMSTNTRGSIITVGGMGGLPESQLAVARQQQQQLTPVGYQQPSYFGYQAPMFQKVDAGAINAQYVVDELRDLRGERKTFVDNKISDLEKQRTDLQFRADKMTESFNNAQRTINELQNKIADMEAKNMSLNDYFSDVCPQRSCNERCGYRFHVKPTIMPQNFEVSVSTPAQPSYGYVASGYNPFANARPAHNNFGSVSSSGYETMYNSMDKQKQQSHQSPSISSSSSSSFRFGPVPEQQNVNIGLSSTNPFAAPTHADIKLPGAPNIAVDTKVYNNNYDFDDFDRKLRGSGM
jgi:hypothetical protein